LSAIHVVNNQISHTSIDIQRKTPIINHMIENPVS